MKGILDRLKRNTKAYSLYISLCFSAFILSLALGFAYGASLSELIFVPLSIGSSLPTIFCLFVLAYLSLFVRAWFLRLRNKQPLKGVSKDVDKIVSDYIDSGRIIDSIPLYVGVMMILITIPVMKSLIAYIHPYQLDLEFIKIEQALHFGHYPQYLLSPIVEKLGMIEVINYGYNFWLGVMLGGYWYAIFIDRNEQRRLIFLWSSLIAWIGMGWGMATALSSVGPIFFGTIYPDVPNPYADYIEYLRAIHNSGTMISSLWVSDLLAEMAKDSNVIDLNGMSAMPSMHVAVATLFAIYMWHVNKIWGLLYTLFALMIMAGSVFLAWHYAIDGYMSAICICVIWYVTATLIKRKSR